MTKNLIPWTVLVALALPVTAFASGGGEAKPAAGEHGKPAEHGAPAKAKEGGGHGEAPAAEPKDAMKEFEITDKYVHKWLKFPDALGKQIPDGTPITVTPRPGEAAVYIFLASWCLPCQKLAPQFKALQTKYKHRASRFIYVFAHDTLKDAAGFAKSYGLSGEMMLASQDMLKQFHEPELPALYLGDRTGWLTWRAVQAANNDVLALDKFLEKHTGF